MPGSPLSKLKATKLKDMHVKPEKKKNRGIEACTSDKPSIPYGLKINLDKDSLKNLGITTKDFSIDGKVIVMAECDVCEIRSSKSADYESESVELRITNMALAPRSKK